VIASDSVLSIYIAYEDFLNARQLGLLLTELDHSYEALYYATAPHLRALPTRVDSRIRVDRCTTGDSIVIELTNGVQQIAHSFSPELRGIVGAGSTVTLLGYLLIGMTRRISATVGQIRRESLEIDHKRQLSSLEAKALTSQIESNELINRFKSAVVDTLVQTLTQLQDGTDEQAAAIQSLHQLGDDMAPHLISLIRVISEPNIQRVTINGEELRGQEESEPHDQDQ
jgi:hypothetical protein